MKKSIFIAFMFLTAWVSSAQYFHGDVPDSYEMWAEDDPFSFEYLRGLASYVSNGVLTAKNLAESPEEWFVFQPIDDKTTSVTGPSSLFPTNETDVILPSLVGGRKVVNIGNAAFGYYNGGTYFNTKIRSIYSATVVTIGVGAFARNQNVLRATMPACLNIGSSSFSACSNIIEASINSATNIGNYAFESCGIKSLILPSVKTMGNMSLNKSSVTNLYVPSLQPGNTNWWTNGNGPVGAAVGATNQLEIVTLGPQAAWFPNTVLNFYKNWYPRIIFRFPRGCDWYKTMSFFTGRTCVEYDPDPWEIQYVGTYGIQNQIKAAASTQDISRAVAPLVSTQALIEATSSLAKTQDVSEAVSMLVSTQTQISASIANLPAQSRFLIYDTATNVVWRRVISNGWEYLVAQTNYVGGAQ